MPAYVEFFVSEDGEHFISVGNIDNPVPEDQWGAIIHDYALDVDPLKIRYVKVIGKTKVMCPDWHKGHGNKLFIFADEITIK